MMSVICPGSTNDNLAWKFSSMCKHIIEAGRLPRQYYIICDEALSSTEEALTPFGGTQIGTWKDSFNYHLSSMRQCIERAFGILTRRWGIFWRPLTCAYEKWPLIVQVCAKLHNLCIDFGLRDAYATSQHPIQAGFARARFSLQRRYC